MIDRILVHLAYNPAGLDARQLMAAPTLEQAIRCADAVLAVVS